MGVACSSVSRGILIAFNTVFFICGTILVAFGIIAILNKNSMSDVYYTSNSGKEVHLEIAQLPDLVMNVAVFMIVLGAIIMIFALIGCIGASTGGILLIVYAILVGILLIAEIALIVYAVALPSKYGQKSEDKLYDSLKEHYKSVSIQEIMDPVSGRVVSGDDKMASWLLMEMKFSCCGARNYTDYQTFDWNRTISLANKQLTAVVPFSCCKNPKHVDDNMIRCVGGDVEQINTEGCSKVVTNLIRDFSSKGIIIPAVTIAVEILLIGASIQLLGGCPG